MTASKKWRQWSAIVAATTMASFLVLIHWLEKMPGSFLLPIWTGLVTCDGKTGSDKIESKKFFLKSVLKLWNFKNVFYESYYWTWRIYGASFTQREAVFFPQKQKLGKKETLFVKRPQKSITALKLCICKEEWKNNENKSFAHLEDTREYKTSFTFLEPFF